MKGFQSLFRSACVLILFVCFTTSVMSGEVHGDFPPTINPEGTYILYSHGFIVEGTDPRPVHPRWGVYDFPAVTKALATTEDTHVIAFQRPAGADPNAHATTLVEQVRALLNAGVESHRITIIGFSRGGRITAYASNALKETPVNSIIMAACGGWVTEELHIELSGRVFSVYETSDTVHSCKQAAVRSTALISFDELAISTGKEHGAFYRPIPEWVGPVNAWIAEQPLKR